MGDLQGHTIMSEVLPSGYLPLSAFLSWSFVCFCHRDVAHKLAALPLLNLYKALLELGPIWLNDIKFCSHSTLNEDKAWGADRCIVAADNRYVSVAHKCQAMTQIVLHVSVSLFFSFHALSSYLVNRGRLNPCTKNSPLGDFDDHMLSSNWIQK